jgi:ORF6N domain.
MKTQYVKTFMPQERIERSILLIRGLKVMLDRDLAELYGVQTRDLNKAVRRNSDRFPSDFMFQLTPEEYKILMFQFGTSRWGGTRKLPYAFTELGVAMLSSVLNSKRAVQVNIQIMRTFAALRELLATHKDLAQKLEEMEKKYDQQFKAVFEAIRQLITAPDSVQDKPKRQIGFKVAEPKVLYAPRKKAKR